MAELKGDDDCKPAAAVTTKDTTASTTTFSSSSSSTFCHYTLVAKHGKTQYTLEDLPDTTTIETVKNLLCDRTRILPKRQKLIGLGKISSDETILSQLKMTTKRKGGGSSGNHNGDHERCIRFILMGTPEEDILVDPSDRNDLPEVIDDFDLDFNAGSNEWLRHVANGENLKKFTETTAIHIMNPPRLGKPLMVLDLDHTLLDFSRKSLERDSTAAAMKRPHMDSFLTAAYKYYDLVVWSQTSWRWLETKLTELGMVSNPGYKFCFVLDKTSMFSITSTRRGGTMHTHQVKPLQIIWTKFPDHWGPHNTIHLDDLERNFALNLQNGLKVSAYHRKRTSGRRDAELVGLEKYVTLLAKAEVSFETVDFRQWMDVVSGKVQLVNNTKDIDAAAASAAHDESSGNNA